MTSITWLNRGYHGKRPSFLTANEKSVKLYQLKERIEDPSLTLDSSAPKNVSCTMSLERDQRLTLPKRNGTHTKKRRPFAEKHSCKQQFPSAHRFHIHSLSASYDNEHFISGDEVSIRLWDL